MCVLLAAEPAHREAELYPFFMFICMASNDEFIDVCYQEKNQSSCSLSFPSFEMKVII
jgi:hypothetical protein